MTVIYVIGPSGAGKSSLCRAIVSADTSLAYVDLDDVVKTKAGYTSVSQMFSTIHDKDFWLHCLREFRAFEKQVSEQDYLIDVGAGTLEARESWTYFKENMQRVMCIWAMPELVYDRKHKGARRTYEEMVATEYSPKRTELYDAIPFRVDTSNQTHYASLTQCQQTLAELRSNL